MSYFDENIVEMDENVEIIEISCTPPEIAQTARSITLNLLPEKSRKKYEKQYDLFIKWCELKGTKKISENILLAYFAEKAKVMKSSTLWSIYSMLRSTISVKNDTDITQYKKLVAFLKRQAVGQKPVKSKILNFDNVKTFLTEAPDNTYLLKKVILILGIAGACRRDELVKMTVDDIEDKQSILIVTIPDSKTYTSRTFTVTNTATIDYLSIYRKYVSLRPINCTIRRLFLHYWHGICHNRVVGMNYIAKVPKDIAQYLGLSEPCKYTGHCFRRTSATLLVNGGGDITQLKKHGGWKSTNVAEGYIDECLTNKIATSEKILGPTPTINKSPIFVEASTSKTSPIYSPSKTSSGIVIKNCENCTFTFNIVNNKEKDSS